ncbi:hypothetical protein POSPLADRAFT_1146253 [Postia placenta MAD-698-R-SB12]|uniref:Peptidase C14 caspase domain-containing protein n=1 Tax=Postia placenta MAD-698-R-SB12 TaxID=670580 RepID=A0A1X6MXX7_9APHY|nr:hypothetical protein POSPLADRAFT_1146253 [Postia placenta MAD-698-R-SB12]OSX61225.1 hypothetical protein POSPLADRAFT_1146253 [Postia placenta MAD-698-R-SB12]
MTYAPRPQKRKALIIGINYDDEDLSSSQASRDLGQLLASRKDAIDFRNLLVDVTLMTDSKDRAHHLIPTRKNMIAQIRSLVRGARPGDTFVFYWLILSKARSQDAGHADQIPCKDHTEEDDMDEVLLAVDHEGTKNKGRYIVDNTLRKLLVDALPPGARLIAIFDACHSGTILAFHAPLKFSSYSRPAVRQDDAQFDDVKPKSALRSPFRKLMPLPSLSLRKTVTRMRKVCTLDGKRSADGTAKKLEHRIPKRSPTSWSFGSVRGRVAFKRPGIAFEQAKRILQLVVPKNASPESSRKCDGFCMRGEIQAPHVICISACNDTQSTWECGRKGSATQTLIRLLRSNAHPELGKLYADLSFKRYRTSCKLHDWSHKQKQLAQEQRRAEALAPRSGSHRGTQTPGDIAIEMVNFSDIQIGSQEKLDWNEVFTF